ncbi:hypothetical protein A7E78_06945 [Syntrophotalea acetylenivorans]|uniref:Solute-binding protein family 3/N-terminal domain-containing protein n=1 Tax=Syntrophotalea acetylenivorans TaxID=1842532 RepID=A0A1L3GNY5_9BACT|nr:PhnD/SsuA/transferrin family substrate-binding protein [Syntrophotalea acetylenivorans]APG27595.1 hypothetical protein A7E78_06945 [Syntrophotalea acetylenivorans]
MKTIIYAILLCLTATAAPGQDLAKLNKRTFHIGVSSRLFRKLNHNEVIASYKVWASTVAKERDLDLDVQVSMLNGLEGIQNGLKNGWLDAVNLATDDYDVLSIDPDTVFYPLREDGAGTVYILLVHTESGIEGVKDLEGLNLVTYESHNMVLARKWLQSEFTRAANGAMQERDIDITTVDKAADGIFKVFFRQADAVIMNLGTFNLACQLNPQLQKKLKIISRSPRLIPSFFIFSPDYQGKNRQLIEEAITGLHNSAAGQQVLTIFQSSRMEKSSTKILDETLSFLSDYKALQLNLSAARQ